MFRDKLMLLIAFSLLAGALSAGCSSKPVETKATSASDTEAVQTTETTEAATSKTTPDKDLNHGHSIAEAWGDRYNEIKRSDDILTNADQAKEYLESCVTLQDKDLEFRLTDTSEDDPGAYMWYEFSAYYNGFIVMHSEFRVITFTDGTICEGDRSFLTCTFADPADIFSKEEALKIYAGNYNDDREYKYLETLYVFTGKGNTECSFTYKYKYDCGKVLENNTILVNAKNGDMVGCWPDAID